MSKDCLKAHTGPLNHNDWLPGFRWVPRSWTSFCKGRFSKPPTYLFGNLGERPFENPEAWGKIRIVLECFYVYPKPIPPLGKWYFSFPYYFAATFKLFKWKILFRLGFRYTEVTNEKGEIDGNLSYYSFPVGPSIRRL